MMLVVLAAGACVVVVVLGLLLVAASSPPKEAQPTPEQLQLPVPPGFDPQPDPPQAIPGQYKQGAVVGTNKMGLTYGDLRPYSKCRIQYRGEWRHMKGQRVGDQGYSDGQNWSVKFPKPHPTTGEEKMVAYNNFLSDYSGPKDPTFGQTVQLVKSTSRGTVAEMLEKGAELPPWYRSGPLAMMDLIAQYCK